MKGKNDLLKAHEMPLSIDSVPASLNTMTGTGPPLLTACTPLPSSPVPSAGASFLTHKRFTWRLLASVTFMSAATATALTIAQQILFPDETPCDTAGCEQEVFRLTGNLDKNEQPCHQLYAFVCGGVKWTPQGGNTLAEVHATNLARLNDTLHSAATKKCATIQAITMPPTFCELSTLYTSCHALYSVEKDLHDTMYAYLTDVGVNVSAWLIHANSTNKLLEKIVEQSLKFDVPSVLWLRLNPDSGLLSVEPARPLFSGPVLRECAEHEDQEQLMQKVVGAIDEVTQNVDELAHDLGHLHTELSAKFVPRKETVIMKASMCIK
ncbi:hypothetical protein MRX96_029740 [Rhipicephalus microplus]